MKHLLRAGAAALAVLLILTTGAAARRPAPRSGKDRAKDASHYIAKVQKRNGSFPGFSKVGSTADAILALVAARRAPTSIGGGVAYLKGHEDEVDDLGEISKTLMAFVAAGEGTMLGSRDLVQEILDAQQPSGQYGDGANNAGVYTHSLAVLALSAAGETPSTNAADWLVAAQCADGGWQFNDPSGTGDDEHCFDGTDTDFAKTDSNSTSLAVQALAVIPGDEALAADPFEMFEALRDPELHGWGYDWSFPLTDSVSTSLVIQAYAAAGRTLPDGVVNALRKLQYSRCAGSPFAFTYSDENGDGDYTKSERTPEDAGATFAGVLGLLRRPYPIAETEVSKPAPAAVCF